MGIKRIKEGQHTLCETPNILQAFVSHYKKVFIVHGNSIVGEEALQTWISGTPQNLAPG
jgi:hypothetical protein